MRLTPEEHRRVEARLRDPEGVAAAERVAEEKRIASRRPWAGVMLACDLHTCRALLQGLAVLARNLNAEALRRALRGGRLPHPETYVSVTVEMLDAIAEGGAFGGGRQPLTTTRPLREAQTSDRERLRHLVARATGRTEGRNG